MNRRILIIILGVLGGLCFCTIGATVLILTLGASSGAPGSVAVSVESPPIVPANEPFLLTIRMRNTSNEDQLLDSIDIQTVYLDGFEVESVAPFYEDAFTIPLVGYESYTFKTVIPANDVLEVNYVLVATAENIYQGEIDICINDMNACTTEPIVTEIGEGAGR